MKASQMATGIVSHRTLLAKLEEAVLVCLVAVLENRLVVDPHKKVRTHKSSAGRARRTIGDLSEAQLMPRADNLWPPSATWKSQRNCASNRPRPASTKPEKSMKLNKREAADNAGAVTMMLELMNMTQRLQMTYLAIPMCHVERVILCVR